MNYLAFVALWLAMQQAPNIVCTSGIPAICTPTTTATTPEIKQWFVSVNGDPAIDLPLGCKYGIWYATNPPMCAPQQESNGPVIGDPPAPLSPCLVGTYCIGRDEHGELEISINGSPYAVVKEEYLRKILDCNGSNCFMTGPLPIPEGIAPPEPMDVPAVMDTHWEEWGNSNWCNLCSGDPGTITFTCTSMACNPHATHKVTTPTCKKGSGRILLQDVDEGWHCIKFPK